MLMSGKGMSWNKHMSPEEHTRNIRGRRSYFVIFTSFYQNRVFVEQGDRVCYVLD